MQENYTDPEPKKKYTPSPAHLRNKLNEEELDNDVLAPLDTELEVPQKNETPIKDLTPEEVDSEISQLMGGGSEAVNNETIVNYTEKSESESPFASLSERLAKVQKESAEKDAADERALNNVSQEQLVPESVAEEGVKENTQEDVIEEEPEITQKMRDERKAQQEKEDEIQNEPTGNEELDAIADAPLETAEDADKKTEALLDFVKSKNDFPQHNKDTYVVEESENEQVTLETKDTIPVLTDVVTSQKTEAENSDDKVIEEDVSSVEEVSEIEVVEEKPQEDIVVDEQEKINQPEENRESVEDQTSLQEEMFDHEVYENGFASFGISEEDLQTIPNFDKLDEAQRALIAQNLQQITLGRIQTAAKDEYKESMDVKGIKAWPGKVWRGMTKNIQLRNLKKLAFEELHSADIEKGGLKQHEDILKGLVQGALDGPGVELVDGKVHINYVSEFEGADEKTKDNIRVFNEAANIFGNIPDEWGYVRDGKENKKQYEQYQDAKTAYENAKQGIIDANLLKTGGDTQRAIELLAETDKNVMMNRFLNTSPDVEKELQSIEDESAILAGLKDTIVEKGMYFGAGFALRSASVGILGLAALPAVGAVIGGWRGRNEQRNKLQDNLEDARRGIKDESETARNVADASSLSGKLDLLMDQLQMEEDIAKRDRIIQRIKARVYYTEKKMEQGLVNFGENNFELKNKYNLLQAVAFAETETGAHTEEIVDPTNKYARTTEKVLDTLDTQLLEKSVSIKTSQNESVSVAGKSGAKKGAAIALGFGALGYAVSEFAPKLGWWGSAASGSAAVAENADVSGVAPIEATLDDTPTDPVAEEIQEAIKVTETPSGEQYDETGASETKIPEHSEIEHETVAEVNKDPFREPIEESDMELVTEEGVQDNAETSAEFVDTVEDPDSTEASQETTPTPEVIPVFKAVESGDTIWKLVGETLEERGLFNHKDGTPLNQAEKTYLIDMVEDKFETLSETDIKAMGIESGDIDKLEVGENIDLSRILNDEAFIKTAVEKTANISDATEKSILHNLENKVTETPVAETPQEIVPENVEQRNAPIDSQNPLNEIVSHHRVEEVISDNPQVAEDGGSRENGNSETITSAEPFMSPQEKSDWIENRKTQYQQQNKWPIAIADKTAKSDWIAMRNSELAKGMGQAQAIK